MRSLSRIGFQPVWLTLLSLLASFGPATCAEPWQVRAIDGQQVDLNKHKIKATVFVFVTNVCPIANAYQPRLRELQKEYEAQGIQFVEVYPIATITREAVIKHDEEFDIHAALVIDSDRAIAKRLGAKVTPETIVVDRAGQVLYRGRIDDQHVALGKKRPEATQHDLANALKAIVADQPIAVRETKAIGCIIR